MVNVIINQPDNKYPLSWTDCLRGHMYATRDGTPFLKLGGWFVNLKDMEMTMGQGLRFREVAGTIEVQL